MLNKNDLIYQMLCTQLQDIKMWNKPIFLYWMDSGRGW